MENTEDIIFRAWHDQAERCCRNLILPETERGFNWTQQGTRLQAKQGTWQGLLLRKTHLPAGGLYQGKRAM